MCVASAICVVTASAHAADNPEALDELKQGYALKQVGNCRDAVPHFARSVQLQSTARALLNLSDCEQKLGEVVAAQGHAAQGREMARQQNDAELVGVADEQLAGIEKRLPRLTIRLSAQTPTGTRVLRDGVAVDPASFGSPVPVNPGAHIVTVSARGRSDRRFDVTVDEGGRGELTVEPGPKLGLEPPAKAADEATPTETDRVSSPSTASLNKPLALVALGVGVAGLATGIVAGLVGGSKHDTLTSECPQNLCPPSAHGDLDAFHTLRTVSTVGYVVGALGAAAGAVLWLTAPSGEPSATAPRAWLGPMSAGIGGRF